MRGHRVVHLLAMFLATVSAALLLAGRIDAQAVPQCLSNTRLSGCKIGGLTQQSDGLIHVKFGYTDNLGAAVTPDGSVKTAVDAAIQKWNAVSGTTGVQFDPVGPNDTPDVSVRLSPADAGGCAAMVPETGVLGYDYNFLTWAGTGAESSTGEPDTSGVIAHELGHFLGLDDAGTFPSSPTIMQQGIICGGSIPHGTVENNDATAAKNCSTTARNLQYQPQPPPPPADYLYPVSSGCTTWWDVTYTYYWNDGWHLLSASVELIWTNCY